MDTTLKIEAIEEEKQYIVVGVGEELYGIDIGYIDNIIRRQKITRVPKSQKYFYGVINLRGEIIPVMSLRRRFNLEDDVFSDKTRIIILKLDQQDLVGIIVDAVREVINLGEKDIDKAPSDGRDDIAKYIGGVGKKGDNLISILNIRNVVSDYRE